MNKICKIGIGAAALAGVATVSSAVAERSGLFTALKQDSLLATSTLLRITVRQMMRSSRLQRILLTRL